MKDNESNKTTSIQNHQLEVIESAPSNIALIKYMGKVEGNLAGKNVPTNASLSYTLNHLRSFVRLSPSKQDEWMPLKNSAKINSKIGDEILTPINLSEYGKKRFIEHLQFLKKTWGIEQTFLIESANNFPSDCGLASSASSFAALTLAAVNLFQSINPKNLEVILKNLTQSKDKTIDEEKLKEFTRSAEASVEAILMDLLRSNNITLDKTSPSYTLSALSRLGSGSSCRSFFSPWAIWKKEYAEPVALGNIKLFHSVIIAEESIKSVSSSQAHKLVSTSPNFVGRVERAQNRLNELLILLKNQNWKKVSALCYEEFMDMHELFHTSQPSFKYMNNQSEEILKICREYSEIIATMDAGPNVHLLFPVGQVPNYLQIKNQLASKFRIIDNVYENELGEY